MTTSKTKYRFIVKLGVITWLVILVISCQEEDADRPEKNHRAKLEFWMTYKDVAELLPSDAALMKSGTAHIKPPTPEEERFSVEFGLNLEDDFGLFLGFNKYKELVQIIEIEQAMPGKDVPPRRNETE